MNDLVFEGLTLMLLGMGTVFVFLTLLVFTTQFMSVLVSRFASEPLPAVSESATSTVSTDPHLLRVLTVAMETYKKKR